MTTTETIETVQTIKTRTEVEAAASARREYQARERQKKEEQNKKREERRKINQERRRNESRERRVTINEGYFKAVKGKRTPGVQIKREQKKSLITVQMKSPNLKGSPELETGVKIQLKLIMIL